MTAAWCSWPARRASASRRWSRPPRRRCGTRIPEPVGCGAAATASSHRARSARSPRSPSSSAGRPGEAVAEDAPRQELFAAAPGGVARTPASARSSSSRTCTGPTRRRLDVLRYLGRRLRGAAGPRRGDVPRRRPGDRRTRCGSRSATSPRRAPPVGSTCRRCPARPVRHPRRGDRPRTERAAPAHRRQPVLRHRGAALRFGRGARPRPGTPSWPARPTSSARARCGARRRRPRGRHGSSRTCSAPSTDVSTADLDELVATGLLVGDGPGLRFRHDIARLAVDEAGAAAPADRDPPRRPRRAAPSQRRTDDARLAFHAENGGADDLALHHARRAGRRRRGQGRAPGGRRAVRPRGALLRAGSTARRAGRAARRARPGAAASWTRGRSRRQARAASARAVARGRRPPPRGRRPAPAVRGDVAALSRARVGGRRPRQAVERPRALGPTVELGWAYALPRRSTRWRHAEHRPPTSPRAERSSTSWPASRSRDAWTHLRGQVLMVRAELAYGRRDAWERRTSGPPWTSGSTRATTSWPPPHTRTCTSSSSPTTGSTTPRRSTGTGSSSPTTVTSRRTRPACAAGGRSRSSPSAGGTRPSARRRVVLRSSRRPRSTCSPPRSPSGLLRTRRGEPDRGLLDDALEPPRRPSTRPNGSRPPCSASAEAAWLLGDDAAARATIWRPPGPASAPLNVVEDAQLALWERRLGVERHDPAPARRRPARAAAPARRRRLPRAAAAWDAVGCAYDAGAGPARRGVRDVAPGGAGPVRGASGPAPAAAVARRRLRALGARSVPAGMRRTTRAAPRRAHVAGAAGARPALRGTATNEEISARLFISVKTVDHHVSAVLGEARRRRPAATPSPRPTAWASSPATADPRRNWGVAPATWGTPPHVRPGPLAARFVGARPQGAAGRRSELRCHSSWTSTTSATGFGPRTSPRRTWPTCRRRTGTTCATCATGSTRTGDTIFCLVEAPQRGRRQLRAPRGARPRRGRALRRDGGVVRTGMRLAAAAAALGLLLGGPVAAAQAAPSVGSALGVQTHEHGHGSGAPDPPRAARCRGRAGLDRGVPRPRHRPGERLLDPRRHRRQDLHRRARDGRHGRPLRQRRPRRRPGHQGAGSRRRSSTRPRRTAGCSSRPSSTSSSRARGTPTHSAAPSLFGHEFMVTDAPNRYGLPAFYSLHVWAWDHNPMGTVRDVEPGRRLPLTSLTPLGSCSVEVYPSALALS